MRLKEFHRKIKDKVVFLFHGLGVEIGWIQPDYQRFIILTAGRTGSNLLIDCLNQHPQIECHFEIFKHDAEKGSSWRHRVLHNNPIRYLKWFVFRHYPEDIRSVGFSLHYYHCQGKKQSKVWEYLTGNNSIKVMHLTRNPLHIFISAQLAKQSDIWHLKHHEKMQEVNTLEINVDPTTLKEHFQEYETNVNRYLSIFSRHELINISYEEFTNDINGTLAEIENWLGINHYRAEARYIKINTRHPSDIIHNYSYLKEFFDNTPWSRYFYQ